MMVDAIREKPRAVVALVRNFFFYFFIFTRKDMKIQLVSENRSTLHYLVSSCQIGIVGI